MLKKTNFCLFKVKNTKSSLEFVKFDEEDKGGIVTSARGYYPYGIRPQEKDHIIYLCYYEEEGTLNIYKKDKWNE